MADTTAADEAVKYNHKANAYKNTVHITAINHTDNITVQLYSLL